MAQTYKIIHYVIDWFQMHEEPEKLGKTKLARILWHADKEFMYCYSESLTDLQYFKSSSGPTPEGYDRLLEQMEEMRLIHSYQVSNRNCTQTVFASLQEVDIEQFQANEVFILDSAIMEFKDINTKQMLEENYDDDIFDKFEDGEIVPLETVFWRDIVEPNEEHVQEAYNLLKERGYID